MNNKEKNQLRIGIVLNYVNMGIGNLIPIFYTPLMLSLLGQSEYGLYKLSCSFTSYLSLMSMGIGSAVTRYLIKANTENGKEEEQKVLGLFVIIFRIIAVMAFAVGILLTLNLDNWYSVSLTNTELYRMKILVFLMVCNTALNFVVLPYMSVVTSHEHFLFYQLMNILVTCIGPILNLIVLRLGYRSIGMAGATLFVSLGVRICYTIYVNNKMCIRPIYKNMPVSLIKEILLFSFWVFIANLAGQLYKATDTVMIGAVPALATTGVAIYSVGCTFVNIVNSITTGISSLLAPRANKMVFNNSSSMILTDESIKIGRLQGYISGLITFGFVAFGQPFISFYAGSDYLDAYWVAIAVMLPTIIPTVQSYCLNILIAENRHRFRSLIYLFIAVINVIGTWFAMQRFGVIGAALMTGVAIFLGNGLLMNWYYQKKSNLDMSRFWCEVGKTFIVPMVLSLCTLLLENKFLDFYRPVFFIIGVVIYIVVYVIITWTFVMNKYEKNLMKSFLRPVLK